MYLYFHQGVAQPEFELTSPIKKSTEVKVVDDSLVTKWYMKFAVRMLKYMYVAT